VKIAHVADSVEVGGAEVMMATLARMQRAEGHQVSIHCLYAEGRLAEELRQLGIQIFMHGPASAISSMRSLRRVLRTLQPEVVHCHNAAAAIYAAPVARLLPVSPVILCTRHGLVDRRPRQEFKFWIAARLFCDVLVAVCEAGRRNMAAHRLSDPAKITVIPNGTTAAPGRAPEDSQRTGFRLVNVARLSAEKDHMTLLRAVAIARQSVPDLAVWIVGEGKLGPRLRQFTEEAGLSGCVEFLGERKDVGAYLAQAHAFVLSSTSEGLPISILEAMAGGLPVISTDVGGIPEVARMIPAAFELVPVSDPAAMAEAIRRFAQKRPQLSELGGLAKQCYERWFTPERMAGNYMQIYRDGRVVGVFKAWFDRVGLQMSPILRVVYGLGSLSD
jgi:glycosyltransferase involved in cell wall biosynthesis